MILCTKNRNIVNNVNVFEKNLYRIADEYEKKGCCDENFFDQKTVAVRCYSPLILALPESLSRNNLGSINIT